MTGGGRLCMNEILGDVGLGSSDKVTGMGGLRSRHGGGSSSVVTSRRVTRKSLLEVVEPGSTDLFSEIS